MIYRHALVLCGLVAALAAAPAHAQVSPDEAAQLKTTLTPFGAERAGSKDGVIPAWTGGDTTVPPGWKSGGRRPDPFASEKPLFSITSHNYTQYADKLTDGQQALFKKYPDYRIDVYPTHRTAAAPQWVYDNTLKNATRAKELKDGYSISDVYGGIPFPIAKNGLQAMWNHILSWRGETWKWDFRVYVTPANGKRFMASDDVVEATNPYYYKDGSLETFKATWFNRLRITTTAPPEHVGEAELTWDTLDPVGVGPQAWAYLTGQRRVRKLPDAAYDTPSLFTSGISNTDEIYLFTGPMDRYNWKLLGKREMYIPYNNNGTMVPTSDDAIFKERFLNPDHVRWELHRVWVVEATLADGKRHVIPKRRFYLDEDTWRASLADGWDAKGQLWKTFWYLNVDCPDVPGLMPGMFGHYDLLTGEWIANNVMNEKGSQITFPSRWPDNHFTSESLSAEGVR
ncbi:DUF1329 domain-containing protein [Paraburkholderia sediminicola]|uniref:DUF1329 domain-containing protein n=1 Tax=Paraburkholderia sediminicola TaxID=458836 RepID=UPI0038BB3105